MHRLLSVSVASALLVAAVAVPARAQFPAGGAAAYSPYAGYSPYSLPSLYSRPQAPFPSAGGPRLNPYLGLLNGGNPAVNYYLGVRPEQERRRFEAGASSQIRNLQLQQELGTAPALPTEDEFAPNPSVTGGYVAVFNNTFGYFPGGGAGGRPAARPAARMPGSTPATPSTPTTPSAPTTPTTPAPNRPTR